MNNVKKENSDILQVQGHMTFEYGFIPLKVMEDQCLTIEAKAIYAYICSFVGVDTTAILNRKNIVFDLKFSEDRYYRHLNILKKLGYVAVKQNINAKGKFQDNIYIVLDNNDINYSSYNLETINTDVDYRKLKQWRKSVYKRDNYTCQLCTVSKSEQNNVILNAHHIKRFIDYPELRYDISNGITLCKNCHNLTYNKENKFENIFLSVIKRKGCDNSV